jgi:hypothetical protein
MYIPHPERAIGPAIFQLMLIGALGYAIYAYLAPRFGHKTTIWVLLIGELVSFLPVAIGMSIGLGQYGDTCRLFGSDHSDWVLILTEHFELYGFSVYSFICLVVSALIVSAVGMFKNPRKHGDETGARPESPKS